MTTKTVPEGEDLHTSLTTPFTLPDLLHSLQTTKIQTKNIIHELELLKTTVISHRGAVLKAKTSGTTVTTIGTGLAITGLILAPFTFGTSLIVSSVGAVTSIGGAATNMITDLVDRSKKKKYLDNIQKQLQDQESIKIELSDLLQNLEQVIEPLIDIRGLSKCEAIYCFLINHDCCNNSTAESKLSPNDSFEVIEIPESDWKPVKKFAFKTTLQSLKLVKTSQALTTLTIAGRSGANTISNVSVSVGRLIGTTVFKTTMAAVGVVFTSIDIALLVREWKSQDPTQEAIDFVLAEFSEEIKRMEELEEILEMVDKIKFFRNGKVIGSSPFSVKTVAGLLEGKREDFYGVAYAKEECNWTDYWVGMGDVDLNSGANETVPITELGNLFPSANGADLLPIKVIDQSILNLNKLIIDNFLEAKNLQKFKILEKSLRQKKCFSIIQDYYNPLPSNITSNIVQVCVAYVKCEDGYLNANKWEYQLVIEMVMKECFKLFCNFYDKIDRLCDDDADEYGEDLNELVEVLINHKSFQDPVALAVFGSHEKNVQILNDVVSSVEDLFRNLRFKIGIWASEVWEVDNSGNNGFLSL